MHKHDRAQVPAYLEALEKLAADIKPGSVHYVEIKHDHWCDHIRGRGACNCSPEVQLVRPS